MRGFTTVLATIKFPLSGNEFFKCQITQDDKTK